MLVISPSIRNLLTSHKRTLFAVVFIFLYSFSITLAVPPTTKYQPGATLDPTCAPGDTNCSVQILPDQTSNANKYLTTDGSSTAWSSSTLVLGGNFTTSGAYATTLTATGTTTLTLPTSGTLATTGNLSQFAATTSAQLAGVISDETGTGLLVFNTAPSFTTSIATPSILTASGALGITPASGSNLDITLATTGDFTVNTNQLYVDTSTGNVGVGDATPSYKLDIDGTLRTTGNTTIAGQVLVGSATTKTFHTNWDGGTILFGTGGALFSYDGVGDQVIASNYYVNGAGADKYIGAGKASNIYFSSGDIKFRTTDTTGVADDTITWTNAMTVTSAGNVGIGTASPGSLLDVSSSTGAATITPTTIRISSVADSQAWDTTTTWGNLDFYNTDTGGLGSAVKARIGTRFIDSSGSATALAFSTTDGSTLSTRMTINNAGYVGIGTTSPGYKLDVNGIISTAAAGSGGFNFGARGGITQDASYNWLFSTNDVANVMTILSASGNVGIGTASPNAPLHVFTETDTSSGYGSFMVGSSASGEMRLSMGTNDAGGYTYIQSTESSTGHAILSLNPGGGNVGVGTAAPGATLTIGQNTTGNNTDYGVSILRHGSLASPGSWTNTSMLVIGDLSNAGPASVDTAGLFSIGLGRFGTGATNAKNATIMHIGSFDSGLSAMRVDGKANTWIGWDRGGVPTNNGTYGLLVYGGAAIGATYQTVTPPTSGMIIEGNVGIGTTSPFGQLHVNSATNDIVTRFTNTFTGTTATDGTMIEVGSSGHTYLWNYENANMYFGVNNAEAMTILSSGNIGIGTTTPGYKLDVNGSVGVSGAIVGQAATYLDIYTNTSDASDNKITRIGGGGDVLSNRGAFAMFYGNESVGAGDLYLTPGGSGDLIVNSGNVGIGVTNPAGNLQVASSSAPVVALNLTASATSGSRGDFAWYNSAISTVATIRATAVTDNVGTNLDFYTRPAAGSLTQVMTILGSGNVGIGTTDPSSKLMIVDTSTLVTDGVRPNLNIFTSDAYAADLGGSLGLGGKYNAVSGSYTNFATIVGRKENATLNNVAGYFAILTRANADPLERMRVTSEGNVGIGTTSPDAKLQIVTSGEFEVANASGGSRYKTAIGTTTSYGYIDTYRVGTGAYPLSINPNGGNVGIGTTAPSAKLEIDQTSGNNFLEMRNSSLVSRASWVYIPVTNGNNTDLRLYEVRPDGGSDYRVSFQSNGNVGIGTTNPGTLFQVSGGHISMYHALDSTNAGYALQGYTDGGGTKTNKAQIALMQETTSSRAGKILFDTSNAAGTMTTQMVIASTGATSITSLISCGGIQTNGSGTMSCTSDETLKDIEGEFTQGLEAIREINPIAFSWKNNSGLYDDGVIYYGFSAQNVQAALPEAISLSSGNKLQVSQLTLMATAINAIKELDIKVQALPEFDDDGSLAQVVAEFLTGIAQGIANVGRVNTDKLCVGQTCVTESQLQELLNNVDTGGNSNGGSNTSYPQPDPDPAPDPAPEEEPPTEEPPAEESPQGEDGPPAEESPVEDPAPEPEPTPEPLAPDPEPSE